jgi:peptidoglycan-associated lipoprotein
MKLSNRLAVSAAMCATILLGACSSTPVAPVVSATPPAPIAPASPNKPAESAPVAVVPIAPYLDPQNALYQKRSIYFDFDQSVLKPEYAPMLEMHGKYLASHSDVRIRVQGNTDEQGGTEYNLALGQKRAEIVVKALKVYGARETQLEAISFGKEKPKALGHDEAAHAENRRSDLAYPAK